MKYVQPYGISDADAPYINGDPTIGRQGSIPPAQAFEHPMRELVAIISKSKITPDGNDLMQSAKGIRSQRMNFVDDTGSANNLSVALDPPLGSYTVGLPIRVRVHTTNTGAATIDAGAGRVAIKRMNGAGTNAGDLPAGGIAEMVYDGAGFQLTNFLGTGAGGGGDISNFYINIPYVVDTSITPNLIIAPFSPAITALTAGQPLLVKVANSNSGATMLRVNALADKAVVANGAGGGALLQGDIVAGDVVLFIYDGTKFWIQPNPVITADCTLAVPTQFATVADALAALKRKGIASTAMVTIQVATSVINPFTVNHSNSDRITIKGTMLAAAPTGPNFAQTGYSAGARASDSANNIVMLRGRYGTEVRCVAGQKGVQNLGPGEPIIRDMLVTGPNYAGSGALGVVVAIARNINCNNVSCWGLDNGWWGGGSFMCTNCFASGCFGFGWLVTGPGAAGLVGGGSFGHAVGGVAVNQNAMMAVNNFNITCNGSTGASAGDCGELTFNGSASTINAIADLYASTLSEIISMGGSIYTTTSPAPGILGNNGAIVIIT